MLLLGVIGVLASAIAGIAWRKVGGLETKIEERASAVADKAHQIELALVSRYVDKQVLRDIFDEKLRPINDRLDLLTHWVEAQSGFPSLHPKLGGGD